MAQTLLGVMLYRGVERPEDLPEARRLFVLAASRGNAEASHTCAAKPNPNSHTVLTLYQPYVSIG